MFPECFLSNFCNGIGCIGFLSYKSFVHFYEPAFIQSLKVGGQVSVRYLQQLLKVIEIDFVIYHKYGHNAQPHAVVENLIES